MPKIGQDPLYAVALEQDTPDNREIMGERRGKFGLCSSVLNPLASRIIGPQKIIKVFLATVIYKNDYPTHSQM